MSNPFSQLTSAVESFTRDMTGSGGSTGAGKQNVGAQPYAADLNSFHPKNKFLFKVTFTFNPEYAELFSMTSRDFSFLIMSIDKPKVNFEVDEINQYNFRSKVVKKTTYDPLTITFIDDIQNRVFEFAELYRLCMSPQARRRGEMMNTPGQLATNGMDFSSHDKLNVSASAASSATVSPLVGSSTSVLERVTIYQYFAYGTNVNLFHFMAPKITSFDWDSVDHEDSAADMTTVSFDYDMLYTETKRTAEVDTPKWGQYDIWANNKTVGIPNVRTGAATGMMGPPTSLANQGSSLFGFKLPNISLPSISNILPTGSSPILNAALKGATAIGVGIAGRAAAKAGTKLIDGVLKKF